MRLTHLCLVITFSILLASAQRPQTTSTAIITTTSTSTTNSTLLGGPIAASGGPSANSANPNISLTNNGTSNASPTTITDPTNSTSPFTLALLQAIEQNHTAYPTQNYTLFLADIHFYSGNLSSQHIAYHYCKFVSADFMQCTLYNGRDPAARYCGTEYFITQALFNTLSAYERNLWHAHSFEVRSGLFVAPDLSPQEDLEVQQWLLGTFGKITDTWRYYDDFPLGPAELGMAPALLTQVNWTLATEMDQLLNMTTTYQQRQQQRAGLVEPARTVGADNYIFSGYATNYEIYSFPIENNGTVLGAANATGPALNNQTASVTTNATLPAANVDLSNLPTSSPVANPGSANSLPNPEAPTAIAA